MDETSFSIKGKLYNLSLNLIVATAVQNSVAAAAATTTTSPVPIINPAPLMNPGSYALSSRNF